MRNLSPMPFCAFCEQSLSYTTGSGKKGVILFDWRGIVGRPQIGWHEKCAYVDNLFKELGRKSPKETVKDVYSRGWRRVVSNQAFPEKGGNTWKRTFGLHERNYREFLFPALG